LPPTSQGSKAADEEVETGEQFGRYRLLKELGHGAMGTVYLAEDSELRRQVALKRPRVAGQEEAELLQRFYQEAHAAATLDHPNICPVYDIGEHDGVPYITMAYVDGRPLSHIIRERKVLNQRSLAVMLRKIALALGEAHEKGVVHRDLKPGNIMLNHRSDPIVMDFGLARHAESTGEERLTKDGMLIGTPGYTSPEQVDGDLEKIGPASDIYSLGVVLYELLCGELPFRGSVVSVIGKILRDEPDPPSAHRADIDPRLEAICLKMMAKSPTDRYSTMGEVAGTLGDFIKASGQSSASEPPPVEAVTPARLEAQRKQIQQLYDSGQWREASLLLQR
jgi:serine/threonine protein kinase